MKNKKAIIGLGAIAVLLFGAASTIAYLTDTESDVNVMTVGNVKISQLEYERAVDENGNWIKSDYEGYGYTADLMQPYTQNKPIAPAVYKDGDVKWDDRNGSQEPSGDKSHQQPWSQIGAPGSNQLFDDSVKNVIDKFVFVKNTGKKDAYYRTIVAIEMPEGFDGKKLHTNKTSNSRFTITYIGTINIEGVNYSVSEYLYTDVLTPGEVSRPSFLQVYLDPTATNEDVELFGSTFEILAFSQAVQTDGFDSADEALDEAFGNITTTNHPWTTGVDRDEETKWNGTIDTSWYDSEENKYTINTAEQLAGLAKLVNEGTSFDKKTITLESDINLDNIEWTPIGTKDNTFKGNFNGNGHTISNLKISTSNEDFVGLFGKAEDTPKNKTSIKNLTINNATVEGHKYVAVLAGNSYTADVENVKVIGLVRVSAFRYAGTITGYSYGQTSNVTIDVKNGSFVKAYSIENGEADNSNAGGVIGYVGEGPYVIKDVKSNIDVIGTNSRVGGIVGLAQKGVKLTNCSNSGNVTINNPEKLFVGGIVGVWMNGSGTVTLENCTFTGFIYVDGEDKTSEIGNGGLVNLPYSETGSGELIIK